MRVSYVPISREEMINLIESRELDRRLSVVQDNTYVGTRLCRQSTVDCTEVYILHSEVEQFKSICNGCGGRTLNRPCEYCGGG